MVVFLPPQPQYSDAKCVSVLCCDVLARRLRKMFGEPPGSFLVTILTDQSVINLGLGGIDSLSPDRITLGGNRFCELELRCDAPTGQPDETMSRKTICPVHDTKELRASRSLEP